MRVLLVGRFQPFHLGHLKLLRDAAERGKEEVVIAIGSSNVSGTAENPLTAKERRECIGRVLEKEGIEAEVAEIPDFNDDEKWTDYLLENVDFDVALGGNSLVKRLLEERGKNVERVEFLEKKRFNGTRIRKLIREGGDWEKLVPDEVADLLKKRGLVERIRSLR